MNDTTSRALTNSSGPIITAAREIPAHPILFAAWASLATYAANARIRTIDAAFVTLAAMLLLTAIVFISVRALSRDKHRAAVLTSALVVLVCSYGYVKGVLAHVAPPLARDAVLWALWALVAAAVILTVRRTRRPPKRATAILNAVAVLVLVTSAAPPALWRAVNYGWGRSHASPLDDLKLDTASGRPDIYYVILDRYPRADMLRDLYGWDNSGLIDALEKRGMYVAQAATTNYQTTAFSLASSLNMTHLGYIRDQVRDLGDWKPVLELLRNHRVGRLLERAGYRHVNLGSFWLTDHIPSADESPHFTLPTEYAQTVLHSSILSSLSNQTRVGWRAIDGHEQFWNATRRQFDRLEAVRHDERPTFTVAHFLLPHDPYVFDADGAYVPRSVADNRTPRDNFVRQVAYANRRILRFLDGVLEDRDKPIVIVQSDEGPNPAGDYSVRGEYWRDAPAVAYKTKFPILNAYLVPRDTKRALYAGITPVNSFRILFKTLFGADVSRTADTNHIWLSGDELYDFVDVTPRVQRPGPDR